MTTLFKHKDGRLRTTRTAIVIFILLLALLALAHKLGPETDKAVVKIEHVFEARQEEAPKAKLPEKIVEKKVEKPVEKQVEKPASPKAVEPVKQIVKNLKQKIQTKPVPVPSAPAPAVAQREKKSMPVPVSPPVQALEKDAIKITKQEQEQEQEKGIQLPAAQYFKAYKHWQNQGRTQDSNRAMVGVKISDLETVYPLFQMKVVALKRGTPHTDLGDNSRVANTALSEFSSTCFVVTSPWKKWGPALKKAGFTENEAVEVRYYTYEFVRNAIYAGALKAFEQGLEQKGLPKDTDPATAEVEGRVYAIHKQGGGSFGIFVAEQVDFVSHGTVHFDPEKQIKELITKK